MYAKEIPVQLEFLQVRIIYFKYSRMKACEFSKILTKQMSSFWASKSNSSLAEAEGS